MQPLRSPSSESSCHIRLNTVADCDYDIEVVVVDFTLYLTISCILNYKEFLYSCFFWKLSIFINIIIVQTDILAGHIIDFS